MQSKTSKASYLHGSFGKGKSHLHGGAGSDPLKGNTKRRAASLNWRSVITKHNDWMTGKKFLLVPYHMIGSNDMESGILGGYVGSSFVGLTRCIQSHRRLPRGRSVPDDADNAA